MKNQSIKKGLFLLFTICCFAIGTIQAQTPSNPQTPANPQTTTTAKVYEFMEIRYFLFSNKSKILVLSKTGLLEEIEVSGVNRKPSEIAEDQKKLFEIIEKYQQLGWEVFTILTTDYREKYILRR